MLKLMIILLDSDDNLSVRYIHQTDASLKLERSESKQQVERRRASDVKMR